MKYLPETLRTLSTQPFHKRGLQFGFWQLVLILSVALMIFRFVRSRRIRRESDDY